MTSLASAAEKSLLGAEGNSQTVKDPASAETEPSAGTAENEAEPGMSMQMGVAGSRTVVMLPSNEGNETTRTEAEKVANGDASLSVSSVWPAHYRRERRVYSEQNPVRNGDGNLLLDEDGNYMYKEPGWRVQHDQSGMVVFDDEQQLCWRQVDKDLLALQTRAAHDQVPESLIEQNQRLQAELEQSQFVHRSDIKSAEQMLVQQAAQLQTEH